MHRGSNYTGGELTG